MKDNLTPTDKIAAIQRILGVVADGVAGPQTMAAWNGLASEPVRVAQIQAILGVDADSLLGPCTQAAWSQLCADAIEYHTALDWPFTARVDGDDLCVDNIVITCFGGACDPQDDGSTASGISTKKNPKIAAVSVAMDGRRFPGISQAVHAALDGSPIPKMPFGTKVVVTIGGISSTPTFGIIDLGPGKQASGPGDPHGLDLTPGAAMVFDTRPAEILARDFEARGSFRILGGAKYLTAEIAKGEGV
jgi:hypothetical protein